MTAFPDKCIPQAIDEIANDPEGEPALWLVLKESEAIKIISADQSGHPNQAIDILKRQPWWTGLAAAVPRASTPKVQLRRQPRHMRRALARPAQRSERDLSRYGAHWV